MTKFNFDFDFADVLDEKAEAQDAVRCAAQLCEAVNQARLSPQACLTALSMAFGMYAAVVNPTGAIDPLMAINNDAVEFMFMRVKKLMHDQMERGH